MAASWNFARAAVPAFIATCPEAIRAAARIGYGGSIYFPK